MGGTLCFYFRGAVALNSSSTDFIAHLLKPYIKEELGDECTEKIFAAYGDWFGPIIFSKLTQDEYMKCYTIMKKIFEEDLNLLTQDDFMRYYTIMKKVFEEDLDLNQEQSKELVQL